MVITHIRSWFHEVGSYSKSVVELIETTANVHFIPSSVVSILVLVGIWRFLYFQPVVSLLVEVGIEFFSLFGGVVPGDVVIENLEHESIHWVNARLLPFGVTKEHVED